MIRPSDKGPGRGRTAGGRPPRTQQGSGGGKTPSGGGGGGSSSSGCSLWTFAPPLCLIVLAVAMAFGHAP
jgi:hypothetical protein